MVIVNQTLSVSINGKNSLSPLGASSPTIASSNSSNNQQQQNWIKQHYSKWLLTNCNQQSNTLTSTPSLINCSSNICDTNASTNNNNNNSVKNNDMNRESRHVHVVGLPEQCSHERIFNYFSSIGPVQKAEKLENGEAIVSFMDVRSAQKAYSAGLKFEGHPLRVVFYEPSKNGLVGVSLPSSGTSSPQIVKAGPSSTSTESHRRPQELHSPSSSSSKQKERPVERGSQHRVVSSSLRRASKERSSSARATDDRNQRASRTSASNNERKNGSESRSARRPRRSPRSSDSSESSRDSPSSSGVSRRHHTSATNAAQLSAVVKQSSNLVSRRLDAFDASTSASNETSNMPTPVGQCSQISPAQGMQGVYVFNLPSTSKNESVLKDSLTGLFKRFGKIIHITFEVDALSDERKALIIFQRLNDTEKLLNDIHSLCGVRLKLKLASHVAVAEAYNHFLVLTSAQASGILPSSLGVLHDTPATYARTAHKEFPQESSISSSRANAVVDALAPQASRTLYVGGLERRTSDEWLRSRYSQFGQILDIEVKNWESPSPFAFIQFADIQSVVRAINASNGSLLTHNQGSRKPFKTNWGHSIVTNKIWIGELPSGCTTDYLKDKIRVHFTDTLTDIVYDVKHSEALLIFSNNESSQRLLNMIKTKKLLFYDVDQKRDVQLPADYCSEKLHSHFVERKFKAEKECSNLGVAGTSLVAPHHESVQIASASLLAPPPDPPSHLRDTRSESRRSVSSGISKKRKSVDGEIHGTSRSNRASYNRQRRHRRRRSNDRSSSSSSSSSSTTSSSATDTSDSRSTSPERRRDSLIDGRAKYPRTNMSLGEKAREQTSCPSSHHNHTSPSIRESHSPITNTSAVQQLSQLLPPPMPSAAILNPHSSKPSKLELKDVKGKRETFRTLGAHSSSNENINEKSNTRKNPSEAVKSGSRDGGLCDLSHDVPSVPETLSNSRLEEIANSVLQHHYYSTGSPGNNQTSLLLHSNSLSGNHAPGRPSHSVTGSSAHHRCSDEGRHQPTSSLRTNSVTKKGRWPWGNDPIKTACHIPLETTCSKRGDPRKSHSASKVPVLLVNLPVPEFAQTLGFARRPSSSVENVRTEQMKAINRRTSKSTSATLPASSELTNGSIQGPSLFTPPHGPSTTRAHPSVSRSASSGSDAVLSPDGASVSAVTAVIPSSVFDLVEDSSPTLDNNALRERIFALGAKFQHIDETIQKTRSSHFDLDRRPPSLLLPQRPQKFEDELERLKAKSSLHSSTSTNQQSNVASTSATTNAFADAFPKPKTVTATNSYSQAEQIEENPKPARSGLTITIPPANLNTSSSLQLSTAVSENVASSVSPSVSTGQLKKPPVPPTAAALKQSSFSSGPTQHIVAFPPNLSVPPPPLPYPPAPPALTSPKPSSIPLISAPPPPPPLISATPGHGEGTVTTNTTSSASTTPKAARLHPVMPSSAPAFMSHSRKDVQHNKTLSAPHSALPSLSDDSIFKAMASTRTVAVASKNAASKHIEKDTTSRVSSSSVGTKPSNSRNPRLKLQKDSGAKSLEDLFRQQAQDSSESRKKQLLKIKSEEKSGRLEKDSDLLRKTSEGDHERRSFKEGEKKEKSLHENIERKEKEKDKDKKRFQSGADVRVKIETNKAKERAEHEKDHGNKDTKVKDSMKEKKPSKESAKETKEKNKEKEKERSKQKEKESSKVKKDEEKKRRELKEKEKKQKEKERGKDKRKKHVKRDSVSESESESSDSSDSDASVDFRSSEVHRQKWLFDEAESGLIGLSMYDRVKRRSSAMKFDDVEKRHKTLEMLQQKKRQKNSQRPQRRTVQIESSSEEEGEIQQDDDSDAMSSFASSLASGSKESKAKVANVVAKKENARHMRKETSEESSGSEEQSSQGSSESHDSEEGSRRKSLNKRASRKTKGSSKLSMDDVFNNEESSDDATRHSVLSLAPSTESKSSKKGAKKVSLESDRKELTLDKDSKKDRDKQKDRGKSREEKEKDRNKEETERKDEKERQRFVKDKFKSEKDKVKTEKAKAEKEKEKSAEESRNDGRPQKKIEKDKERKKRQWKGEHEPVNVTEELLEKKKPKMEKSSLTQISMFPEPSKKPMKPLKSEKSKVLEKSQKSADKLQVMTSSAEFERRLAKKLRKEQKQKLREEGERRIAEEEKQKVMISNETPILRSEAIKTENLHLKEQGKLQAKEEPLDTMSKEVLYKEKDQERGKKAKEKREMDEVSEKSSDRKVSEDLLESEKGKQEVEDTFKVKKEPQGSTELTKEEEKYSNSKEVYRKEKEGQEAAEISGKEKRQSNAEETLTEEIQKIQEDLKKENQEGEKLTTNELEHHLSEEGTMNEHERCLLMRDPQDEGKNNKTAEATTSEIERCEIKVVGQNEKESSVETGSKEAKCYEVDEREQKRKGFDQQQETEEQNGRETTVGLLLKNESESLAASEERQEEKEWLEEKKGDEIVRNKVQIGNVASQKNCGRSKEEEDSIIQGPHLENDIFDANNTFFSSSESEKQLDRKRKINSDEDMTTKKKLKEGDEPSASELSETTRATSRKQKSEGVPKSLAKKVKTIGEFEETVSPTQKVIPREPLSKERKEVEEILDIGKDEETTRENEDEHRKQESNIERPASATFDSEHVFHQNTSSQIDEITSVQMEVEESVVSEVVQGKAQHSTVETENAVSSIVEDAVEENPEEKQTQCTCSQIPSGSMINFVASSDAECSAVSMVDIKAGRTLFIPESCDSSEGFELIDEGRVETIQDSCVQLGDTETSELVERDIHDVQETEDAVLSIALIDDDVSQHGGDDGVNPVDVNYMSDTTSRRSSVTDPAVTVNDADELPKYYTVDSSNPFQAGGKETVENTKQNDSELEKTVPETETDVASSAHIDEVIDDVVSGGYVEVDAERLMQLNTKKAEEEQAAQKILSSVDEPQTCEIPFPVTVSQQGFSVDAISASSAHCSAFPSTVTQVIPTESCMVQQIQQRGIMQKQPISQQLVQPSQQLQPGSTQQHQQIYQSSQAQQSSQSRIQQTPQPSHISLQHSQQQDQQFQIQHQVQMSQEPQLQQQAQLQQHLQLKQQTVVQQQTQLQQVVQQQPTQGQQGVELQQQHSPFLAQPQSCLQFQHLQNQAGHSAITFPSQSRSSQEAIVRQDPKSVEIETPSERPTMPPATREQFARKGQNQAVSDRSVGQQPLFNHQQAHSSLQEQKSLQTPTLEQRAQFLQQQFGNSNVNYSFLAMMNAAQHQEVAHVSQQQVQLAPQQNGPNQTLSFATNSPAANSRIESQGQTQSSAVTTCEMYLRATQKQQQQHQPQPQPQLQQQQQPHIQQQHLQQPQAKQQQVQRSLSVHSGQSSNVGTRNGEMIRDMHSQATNSSVLPNQLHSPQVPGKFASASEQQMSAVPSFGTRQQQSPALTAQQAINAATTLSSVFGMGLPTTTANINPEQYFLYRASMIQAASAYSGIAGSYGAPPHATYPTPASLSGGTSALQPAQRLGQEQHHSQPTSMVSQQQAPANMAAVAQQQLSAFYTGGGLQLDYFQQQMRQIEQRQQSFQNSSLQRGQQPRETQVSREAQQSREGQQQREPSHMFDTQQQSRQDPTTSRKQSAKAVPHHGHSSSQAKYPIVFQGIVALKAHEATIQMHRVSGNTEMAKHSLNQFETMSGGLPVIRINQRMRMETNQLETVRSKMNDERSYVALVCLACGKDKDDIRHQSEVLKERFVDYLISKVAAGICNLGNERHPVPDSIVHVFPPCNFASEFLRMNASDLLDTIQQQAINYLFIVITATN